MPAEFEQVAGTKEISDEFSGRSTQGVLDEVSLESHSDVTLLNFFKAGSNDANDAMGILFKRYRRLVLSVSLKILRDRTEAEDLVQDVFVEICKKVHLFDETRGTVKMWILQYAYSRSLNRRSYLAIRQTHESLNGYLPSGDGHLVPPEAIQAPDALEGLTLEERGNVIRNALKALPEKQKRVIELVYFQGLLIKEIPEQIGENFGNVRNLYYRGLKKLQETLRLAAIKQGSPADDHQTIIRSSLSHLPPKQREVFELAYFKRLPMREIADRTNESVGTLRSRYRKAVARLQQRLGSIKITKSD